MRRKFWISSVVGQLVSILGAGIGSDDADVVNFGIFRGTRRIPDLRRRTGIAIYDYGGFLGHRHIANQKVERYQR